MVSYFRKIILLLLIIALGHFANACTGGTGSVEKIVCLADSLKATLTSTQISTLQLSYAYSNAQTWSNLPTTLQPRLGIKLGSLTTAQLNIAKLIIEEVSGNTTNEGYDEFKQLLLADDYLGANGGGANSYGAGLYYLCFNGTPTLTGLFEVKVGGHHLAIENTYNNGVMVGATPHFEALEPLTFTTSGTTYTPMAQEKDAFVAMLAALNSTDLATAHLSSTFSDILLGAANGGTSKDWTFPATKSGLKVGTLSSAQKALVMEAIKTYVLDVDNVNSTAILAQYQNDLDNTYIAYSGSSSLTVKNDYVRIDGLNVWIEFSVQGGIVFSGVHYHSIWRDHLRDYGGTGSTNGTQTTAVGGTNTAITNASIENNYVELKQNYPNPFSDETKLPLIIKSPGHVRLELYDLQGKRVATLVDDELLIGSYFIPIHKQNENNSLLSGNYTLICTYESRNKSVQISKKIIIQ